MTTSQSNAATVVASRGRGRGHGHASAPGSAPKATAAFTLSHKEARLLDLLVSLAAALLQPTACAFGYLISVRLPHISLFFSANKLLLFFSSATCRLSSLCLMFDRGTSVAASAIARLQCDPSYQRRCPITELLQHSQQHDDHLQTHCFIFNSLTIAKGWRCQHRSSIFKFHKRCGQTP